MLRSYVKGAPERIFDLCDPDTIPDYVRDQADFFASEGCYVTQFKIKGMPNVIKNEISVG